MVRMWRCFSLEYVKVELLAVIAVCLVIIVFQNFFPTKRRVRVVGSVSVDNTVDVNVDNTVDVNLEAINGYSNVFYNNPRRGEEDKYYRIPVCEW